MDQRRFDTFTKALHTSRRMTLAGLIALPAALLFPDRELAARRGQRPNEWKHRGTGTTGGRDSQAVAEKKRKRPGKKNKGTLCLSNGDPCKKKGRTCKAGNCLQPPFTIAARWSNAATDYDTYVFLPNAPGAALPSPFIDMFCNSTDTGAGSRYPFAFVDRDATGPGDEVTTVASLLAGTYEYWIEFPGSNTPAGELTVELRNKNGRIMRSWSNPPNTSETGWHVFDIQGSTRGVTSVDALSQTSAPMPKVAHYPNTELC